MPLPKATARPKVLVFLGRYLPGFNSGGPVRTVSCMVEALASDFDFFIVTLNRDSGSLDIYQDVRTGDWNTVGSAKVFYISRFTPSLMRRISEELQPDVVYFNGFFSTSSILGLLARKLGAFRGIPIVLATRGDLAGGALGLKSAKKRFFLFAAKAARLYQNLIWHASSERERTDMLRELTGFELEPSQIHVAPDLGSATSVVGPVRTPKIPGEAKFVTLGRLTRMKNLSFTLDRLAELQGKVSLDVFGPLEDRNLWRECEEKIRALPRNITVHQRGPIDPVKVVAELATRHFFILPTLGENYGHVIIEAMVAGCPVVISDRTQWLDLSRRQAGWDLPLEDVSRWRSVLQDCVAMDEPCFRELSAGASEFGRKVMNSEENLQANFELFRRAVAMRTPRQAAALEELAR